MQGPSDALVDEYGDEGLQLVIIVGDTSSFGEEPTADNCLALAATVKATVLYVPGGALRETYGMEVNSSAALLDQEGRWLSDPENGDAFGVLETLF